MSAVFRARPVGGWMMRVRGDGIRVAVLCVIGRQRVEVAALRLVEHPRAFAFAPSEVVACVDVVDRLDLVFADVPEEHPMRAAGIPTDAVRVAHAERVDLTKRAG